MVTWIVWMACVRWTLCGPRQTADHRYMYYYTTAACLLENDDLENGRRPTDRSSIPGQDYPFSSTSEDDDRCAWPQRDDDRDDGLSQHGKCRAPTHGTVPTDNNHVIIIILLCSNYNDDICNNITSNDGDLSHWCLSCFDIRLDGWREPPR